MESKEILETKLNFKKKNNNNHLRKVINLSEEELKLHKKYLKEDMTKNNY